MTSTSPSEEASELLGEVRRLIVQVQQVNSKLELYAPREEVVRDSKLRAWRFLAFAVAIILITQAMTMTTISYCFLDANGDARPFCSTMPGYSEAVQQNDVRLDRFERLLGGIENSQNQLDDIDRRLDQLEAAQ